MHVTDARQGEQQLLSVVEAAEALNLRPGTIRSWYRAGKLAHVRVGKKTIRIPASEILRIISAGFAPSKELQQ